MLYIAYAVKQTSTATQISVEFHRRFFIFFLGLGGLESVSFSVSVCLFVCASLHVCLLSCIFTYVFAVLLVDKYEYQVTKLRPEKQLSKIKLLNTHSCP